MKWKKHIKIVMVLGIVMIAIRCTTNSGDKTETNWLTGINNTSWEHGSEILKFSPSGKEVLKDGSVTYTFCYAETSRSGVYFTDIEFPPTKWYLFHLSNNLIQYGPFLSKNDIVKDSSTSTVFTKLP